LLRERGIEGMDEASVQEQQALELGQTLFFISVEGVMAGLFAVADSVKETTLDAVQHLHQQGIRLVMLTGDNERTAGVVGKELLLDEIHAEMSPADKIAYIKKLRQAGRCVAMCGDGINDAPALAAADVGIAMGTGSDAAIESGGITLIKGDLLGVERAVRLSRAMMRNIRQNLFLAFIYNLLGVPLAAGILYPSLGLLLNPMVSSFAMTLSSLSVIANALRLKKMH
jgi:Cu+-exporting ATPase